MTVYEGQCFRFMLHLHNQSKLPVASARFSIQDSCESEVSEGAMRVKPFTGIKLLVDEDLLKSSIPLRPDHILKLPVDVTVGQPVSGSQEEASEVDAQV